MAGQHIHNDTQHARDAWFDRIVHEHARLLYRVAFSVLRHPEDAEDAVADTLFKLLRSHSWEGVTNERAFLARSVWRTALDRFESRRPTGELDLQLEDDRSTPEASAAGAEERTLLHALIDRLPVELREPLLLSAVEELNSREIGELMQLPEGTVRTRLMRARATLRQEYDEMQQNRRGREVAARGNKRWS